jgi:hypothetical protein
LPETISGRRKAKHRATRPQSILDALEARRLLALTINPTFDSTITSDPNAATIMNTINTAIAAYASSFSDSATVNITFQEVTTGLGGSSTFQNTVDYDDYRAALVTHATTADDATALATLPTGANNPVNNGTTVILKTALIRALGLSGGSVASDCTISLNTSICNLDRTSVQDPTKYDLLAVTCHEIDEAIATGSALDNQNNGDPAPATIKADDLYRFDQTGARSYDTALATQAFFSINGGTTTLARFNQSQNGDFGDWFSTGPHTPQIQDAFGTPGATPNLVVELRRLDVLGYKRVANVTPTGTAAADQTAVEGASKSFDLGSFSDADTGPWNVNVSWGDGTPNTIFFVGSAGAIGTKSHTYAEEGNFSPKVTITDFTGLSDSKSFNVAVSDPAVVATGGFTVNAVEGAPSGSQTVATFTDPGGAEPLADYSATIDWGDGTAPGAGTNSFSGGTFTFKGSHTYAEESAADHAGSNPYDITVTISHEAAPTTTVHSSAVVSDPAVTPTGGFTFTAVEGVPSATQTVATFTDPGGAEALTDYSASIDWGDGTAPSPGTITFAGGVYTVQGSHTYATGLGTPADFGNTLCDADPPTFHKPITVTISHESAPTAQAVSDATIAIPPASAHLASDGSLIVVGTTGDDKIHFNPVGNQPRTVDVRLGSVSLGTFTVGSAGRIVVAALAGDDDVQLAGAIQVDTALYGGPGNDRLNGGGGRNIEVGCDGDDQLNAGKLGDLLVGGLGSDRIIGGNGDDILIAGLLVDGANVEDDQYADLVGILNAGQVNLPFKAADDGVVDRLTGAAGIDTAYYNFLGAGVKDIFTDKAESAFDI